MIHEAHLSSMHMAMIITIAFRFTHQTCASSSKRSLKLEKNRELVIIFDTLLIIINLIESRYCFIALFDTGILNLF